MTNNIKPVLTKIKVTTRQKKLALKMVENMQRKEPLTKQQVLEDVGYNQIAKSPSRILESKGYLQALRDLGLTEELVTVSLIEDIEKKPQNRVKELSLASDILQMRKPIVEDTKHDNKHTTYNFLFNEVTQQQIQSINEAIKKRLTSQ